MSSWSISPDSATIDSNGYAIFPKNTGNIDIIYTITCTNNEGCTSSIKYTVKAGSECQPVQCGCDDFNVDTTAREIPDIGGTVSIPFTACPDSNVTVNSNVNWLNYTKYDNYVEVTAEGNFNDEVRNGQISIKMDNCTEKTVNISQNFINKYPRLIFRSASDVYYKYGAGTTGEFTLLHANEELIIQSEQEQKLITVCIGGADNHYYELESKDSNNDFIYLNIAGNTWPNIEYNTLYDEDARKWFGTGDISQFSHDFMSLNGNCVCPSNDEEMDRKVSFDETNKIPNGHFNVHQKKIELELTDMNLYTKDIPFPFRTLISKTEYKCGSGPSYKGDAYICQFNFYNKLPNNIS